MWLNQLDLNFEVYKNNLNSIKNNVLVIGGEDNSQECYTFLLLNKTLFQIDKNSTYDLQLAWQNSSPLGSVMAGVTHWYPFKDF